MKSFNSMIWIPAKLATAWEWQWCRLCFRYVHLSWGGMSMWNVVQRFSVRLWPKEKTE